MFKKFGGLVNDEGREGRTRREEEQEEVSRHLTCYKTSFNITPSD